jgi:cell division septal protein FtsQ
METDNDQPGSRRSRGSRTKWVLVFLLLSVLLYFAFDSLTIRHLEIHSISRISASEVALSAGLDRRANYLTLNERSIRDGINANNYLIYLGMEKRFPDTLILYVKERIGCSSVKHNGIQYVLDDQGMVLERDTVIDLNNAMISVTGLDLRDIRKGKIIVCRQAEQLQSYIALMGELEMQDYVYEISVINLSDMGNIYLVTRSGYTVTVGDSLQMRAKIGTVRAVIEKLKEMGKKGGMIEAGVPGVATYSPDDALNMRIY